VVVLTSLIKEIFSCIVEKKFVGLLLILKVLFLLNFEFVRENRYFSKDTIWRRFSRGH